MIITQSNSIPEYEVEEVLGLVIGHSTRAASFVKDWFGSVRDFFGGKSSAYDGVLSGVHNDAYLMMLGDAQAKGADAIIEVAYALAPMANTKMLSCSFIGTAVRLKKKR